MPLKPPKAPIPDPETLALQALAYILADEDEMARFLNLTGLDAGAVRRLPQDPAGLGAVLDHLLGWEPLLIAFSASIDMAPEQIAAARRRLPGGESAMD